MNYARTALLLAAMTALFLVVGYLLGGQAGLLIALVAAAGMNFYSYWNSDKMVLRMHGAHVLTREDASGLYALVEHLAARASLPMPAVYFIDTPQPNAFATGRNPENAAVAVTRGLMESLNREELAGVIAHELAHIRHHDTLLMTITASIAGAIGFIANFGLFFGGSRDGERPNPLLGILLMFLAPVAAAIVQMAISRSREYEADRGGAEICGDPADLAGALARIEQIATGTVMPTAEHNPATAHMFIINPLRLGGIDGLFRTHPATEERIRRLMAMRPGMGIAQPVTSTGRRGSVPQSGGRPSPWG